MRRIDRPDAAAARSAAATWPKLDGGCSIVSVAAIAFSGMISVVTVGVSSPSLTGRDNIRSISASNSSSICLVDCSELSFGVLFGMGFHPFDDSGSDSDLSPGRPARRMVAQMSARFYVNLPLAPGPFTLDGAEAHHLATVCRLRPGSEVCLFNGDGSEYPARITQVARREITLEITGVDRPQRELPFSFEVAAPLPKGDRCQFLVEKLTELGVTAFVPLTCARSVVHPREAKREKLERYVIEASKQCGRNVLMRIAEATWSIGRNYVSSGDAGEIRILAHPYQAGDLADLGEGCFNRLRDPHRRRAGRRLHR